MGFASTALGKHKRSLQDTVDPHRPKRAKRVHLSQHHDLSPTQTLSSDDLLAVKAFARHGGPDLQHLRGFRMAPNTSEVPESLRSSGSASTRKSVYNRITAQKLVDSNIYPQGYRSSDGTSLPKPANWQEIKDFLSRRRESLSPFSEDRFEEYQQADDEATKERQVCEVLLPLLQGKVKNSKCFSGGVLFRNLTPLNGDEQLPFGNPDRYYGTRPEDLDPRIRRVLSSKIQPTTQDDMPILPNFFLAIKGPEGTKYVADIQASYDGAIGSRAIHALREYAIHAPSQSKLFDNRAYVLSGTYLNGTLTLFSNHISRPDPKGPVKYITKVIGGWCMRADQDMCRKGIQAYRNAMELAESNRSETIRLANSRLVESIEEPLVPDAAAASTTSSTPEPQSLTPLPDSQVNSTRSATSRGSRSGATVDDPGGPVQEPRRSKRQRRNVLQYSSKG